MPDGRAVRVLEWVRRTERLLVFVAFAALVLIEFTDVLSRELTGAGLYWAARSAVWANVIVVMAGMGLASANGAHLRPRFADRWLPERFDGMRMTLQHLFMALFCLFLGSIAAQVVYVSWQLGEVDVELFLPIWPVQLFLPLAFFTVALKHLVYACNPALRPDEHSVLDGISRESDE